MGERNELLDNAKGLAIILVIFGHILTTITYNPVAKTIYLFVNSIHIPLFVMISGMLSKPELDFVAVVKYIKKILIPFLIFDILYEIFHIILYKHVSLFILGLAPYWLMWYLLALFVWRMVLPVFYVFKKPILIAFAITSVLGYINSLGEFLNISKTFFFFPFFLFGAFHLKSLLSGEKFKRYKKLSVLIIISGLFFYAAFWKFIHIGWVLGNFSYSNMGMDNWYGFIFRLAFFVLAGILSLSVLCLLPNKKTWLTRIGEKSLYVYLWHGFIVAFLRKIHFMENILKMNEYFSFFIFLALSVFTALILSLNPFQNISEKLFKNTTKDIINSKFL